MMMLQKSTTMENFRLSPGALASMILSNKSLVDIQG